MFQPNKKTNLNEGRNVTDGLFTYGGFPRILNEGKKLAKKDYDKDGKLETSEEEHRGAVDRAIKAKKGMMKEEFDEVDMNVIEDLLEELFDEEDMDIIIEAAEKKKWIQKAIKKEGSLRKTLKAKKGEKIPEKKLEAAAKKGGKTGKRARLALTLKKLNENVTRMFNDADDSDLNDEKIATQPDAITWNGDYPSESYKTVALAARDIGDQLLGMHRQYEIKHGRNYMQRANFMQQPEVVDLLRKRAAAQKAVEAHPHHAEAQKGNPSRRMAQLSPQEQARHDEESVRGTPFYIDPDTKKPVYGKRPSGGGLGT